MKKLFTLMIICLLGGSIGFAQGNSGKNKEWKKHKGSHGQKHKQGYQKKNYNTTISKNQPTNVTAAFQRDYPNATNVSWGKSKGDWTATFTNGLLRSTAVYHANGDRKDTRTFIARKNLPGKSTMWDRLFRANQLQQNNIIQIEQPQSTSMLYRLVNASGTAYFYDQFCQPVNYDY